MSADIIPFIPRRNRKRGLSDFYESASPPDDLVMDHVDTSPCEYVWPREYVRPDECEPASTENVNV
jgi:hypothetical protein